MASTKILSFAVVAVLLAASPAFGEDDRGEQLFQLCAQCHMPTGGGNEVDLAPPIAGLSDWYVKAELYKFRSGVRGMHPDDVAGLRMHPMALSLREDPDLEAVATYVASLPPAYPEPTVQGGDAQRGQAYYTPCAACHGPKAEGMEVLGGPNLRVSADWYLLKQLHNFRAGLRGTDPRDVTGMRMRPMSMTLPDEQAMKDVIAYIMTLR